MGLLSFFSKTQRPSSLTALPSGSFTVDREGRVMTTTLPGGFPEEQIREIAQYVLASFRAAKKAEMPLAEIIIHFATLKLLARELRGGAIVFLMPQNLSPVTNKR